MRVIQWLFFVLLTVLLFVSVPTLWLGVYPGEPFIDFISGWKVIGTVIGLFATYTAVIAFIFGWDPRIAISAWVRRKVILPALTRKSYAIACCLVVFLIVVLEFVFLFRFFNVSDPEIKKLLEVENFQAVDELLQSKKISDKEFWLIVNDAMREQFFSTSQGSHKNSCRDYLHSLEDRSYLFESAWHRYAAELAMASCRKVVDDPILSLGHYNHAANIARLTSQLDERFIKRKMAAIYLYDANGKTDIKVSRDRYHRVIALLADDASFAAQRNTGSAYYLLEEYSKAAKLWSDALDANGEEDIIEKKMLLNNIALAYGRIGQFNLAINKASEGGQLAFNENDEAERREQIRILSTLTNAYLSAGDCQSSALTWSERQRIKKQESTGCTALIDAQVKACTLPVSNYQGLMNSLLSGVGQDPASFIDRTSVAITSLVDQADRTFSECYLGLKFRKEQVLRAALSGI